MRNHEIERIYMQQLRNVESAVYVLKRKKREYEQEISVLKKPLLDPKKPVKPQMDIADMLVGMGVGLGVGLGLAIVIVVFLEGLVGIFSIFAWITLDSDDWFMKLMDWIWDNPLGIGITVVVITFVTIIICTIKENMREYQNAMREYKEYRIYYNKKCEKNITEREQRAEMLKKRGQQLERIESELRKGLRLRDNLYVYDWIPVNYRNIRVTYYISDMVTSSAITIEEALKYYLLQEVNNKLDEVLRRLDEIIRNQNQIILQQAIAEAQNEKKIRQNEVLIRQMAQVEKNTETAAQYARLAADYSEANAYFSWANYLKNSR